MRQPIVEFTVRTYPDPAAKKTPRTSLDRRAVRREWRRLMYERMQRATSRADRESLKGRSLEVEVFADLSAGQIRFHDLDNLLKDVFDAMQGRLGGSKAEHRSALIGNDNQIHRVTMEKREVAIAKSRRIHIAIGTWRPA